MCIPERSYNCMLFYRVMALLLIKLLVILFLHKAYIPRGDVHTLKILQLHVILHILSGLFRTNHWVEFDKISHEASISRGDVHTLKVLQLHETFIELWPFYLLSCWSYFVRSHILSEAIFCPAYFLQTTGWNSIFCYMNLLYQEEICIP